MKGFVHVGAPAATLIGVLISAWGSYLLTLFYHRFKPPHFWRSIARLLWYVSKFQIARASRKIRVEAQIGEHQSEDRFNSLAGVYLLFFGFVLQGFGALFWLIDSIMDVLEAH